jgi:zinc transport system ATP-binding protein
MTSLQRPRRDPCTCADGKPLLVCQGLEVGHAGRGLLPPFDFTLAHGELAAVVGRNGAGKTTWLRTLLGLLPPVAGRIRTCTWPLAMAYIPQRGALDPIAPLRARDVAAMGLERGRSILRPRAGRATRRRVDAALEEMDLAPLAHRLFRELSEGQKQRVLMARLLASQPELAVLDEPTAAMDEVAERQTLETIDRLRRDHGLTVMIVSHHLAVVAQFAHQVVFLDRESGTVAAGPPQEVFGHPAFRARYGEEAAPAAGGAKVPAAATRQEGGHAH